MTNETKNYVPRTAEAYVLEVYVPKRLRYLGKLYTFLFDQLQSKGVDAIVRGYSIYEVDGAFVSLSQDQTPQIYDEKTLVIRLIYDLPDAEIETRIHELAREVIAVTQSQEEEIWILRSQATQFRFIKEEST
ncbi:MAG: hypothetical protein ACE5PV_14745 [Candidatus Poribacteria bacterium]